MVLARERDKALGKSAESDGVRGVLEEILDRVDGVRLLAVEPHALPHEERIVVDVLVLDDAQAIEQVVVAEVDVVGIAELPEFIQIAPLPSASFGRLIVVKEKLLCRPDCSGPLTLLMTRVRQPIVATQLL